MRPPAQVAAEGAEEVAPVEGGFGFFVGDDGLGHAGDGAAGDQAGGHQDAGGELGSAAV